MTTTFENACLGDKVYDYYYDEYGTVIDIETNFIEVKFTNNRKFSYTLNGCVPGRGSNQILFWAKPTFTAPVQPPQTKLINGIEVPDISFKPEQEEVYTFPNPLSPILHDWARFFIELKSSTYRYENGFCYPDTDEGRQAAILHAKAMLGIKDPL